MPNISCTEFSRLLERAVETRQGVDQDVVRAHVAECTDCRGAWLDSCLLESAIERWQGLLVPSVDLADRVLSRLADRDDQALISTSGGNSHPAASVNTVPFTGNSFDPKSDQEITRNPSHRVIRAGLWSRPGSRRAFWAVAVVALVLVVGFALRPWDAGRLAPPVDNAGVAAADVPKENPADRPSVIPIAAPHAAIADEAQVQALVRDAGTAYWSLASGAAEAVTSAAMLIPPPESKPQAHPENDGPWVDQVGRNFEPVTRHLSQAFGFLIDAVPADRSPST